MSEGCRGGLEALRDVHVELGEAVEGLAVVRVGGLEEGGKGGWGEDVGEKRHFGFGLLDLVVFWLIVVGWWWWFATSEN